MGNRMRGKKAVVVGAGQPEHKITGNGRAIATLLAREGAEVCAVDREPDRAKATVEQIVSEGGKAHVIIADVANPDDCARLIEESHAKMGRIDALVNNVGMNHGDADPLKLDVDNWKKLMDVNLRATWLTSRAVVPIMEKQGGGAITNTSTVGSITGGGPLFAYSISKAGLNALTHFFAVSYAEIGVRCNAVLPAWILTPHSIDGLTRAGITPNEEELKKNGARYVPLGRMGAAEDVANATLFLSSDEASFITGQLVPVDGGMLSVIGKYERKETAK